MSLTFSASHGSGRERRAFLHIVGLLQQLPVLLVLVVLQLFLLGSLSSTTISTTHAFSAFTRMPSSPHSRTFASRLIFVHAEPNDKAARSAATTSSTTSTSAVLNDQDEETKTEDIVGAAFFGGNKQKEEFYDPVAEQEASLNQEQECFDRFQTGSSTSSIPLELRLAQALQAQINQILYPHRSNNATDSTLLSYAPNLKWTSPFSGDSSSNKASTRNNNPFEVLAQQLEFYRKVDCAILSCHHVNDSQYKCRWELSLAWPTFWEPRVLVTGTSLLKIDNTTGAITVLEQTDQLDTAAQDFLPSIVQQILPRFWDIYHIGMTPSAELAPRTPVPKSFLSNYRLYELPPRWALQVTMNDLGTREDANAAVLPNHAFSCVIKTMGPQKQRYVPTSPIETKIVPNPTSPGAPLTLEWNVPISVECLSQLSLPLPGQDPESDPRCDPACKYVYQEKRRVATLPFGGGPQDPQVAELRKKLYQAVLKDGMAPRMDASGRPIFFFWQNGSKACYTEEGLGMSVYEWRPAFVEPNEIGIELEN